MKVIDLLNKIANGEELPKKIKYDDKIYYMVGNNDYENYEYEETPTLLFAVGTTSYINEKIEILDEEEDKKIEPLVLQNFTSNQRKIARKVNEIIDYINKGDK